jgi:hypothetical protein
MKLLRFTVRRLMIGIATLAVSWSIFSGTGDLIEYVHHVQLEKNDREDAVIWEEKKELDRAHESRRMAELMNQEKWAYVPRAATVLTIIVLGIVMGGFSLVLKARKQTEVSGLPEWLETFRVACLTGSKIVGAGLLIGWSIYLFLFLFVLAIEDS